MSYKKFPNCNIGIPCTAPIDSTDPSIRILDREPSVFYTEVLTPPLRRTFGSVVLLSLALIASRCAFSSLSRSMALHESGSDFCCNIAPFRPYVIMLSSSIVVSV